MKKKWWSSCWKNIKGKEKKHEGVHLNPGRRRLRRNTKKMQCIRLDLPQVTIDSRQVEPGSLYIAIVGEPV